MKDKNITFVVNSSLDVFHPEFAAQHGKKYSGTCSAEWTKKRIEFFQEWTLKSLRNQSVQDFRVFMLCSEKSKSLIGLYDWDANIEHCYDYGEAKFAALDTDYIAMTNLDSDDLFHKDAIKIIQENLILSDKVERLLTSDYYRWLFHHNCFIHITDPLKVDTKLCVRWSPCWTLIFPKAEYKTGIWQI